MADITNKNELKRRIELFLDDELDYSINEDFCKETMKMMREFIGHASHRLDCEESRVKSLKKKLKEYKDLEEQGLLLRLPLKIEDKVYSVTRDFISEYTICSIEKYNEGFFFNWKCEKGIYINVRGFTEYDIGKTVFLTKAEAEQKLKEMESD